MQQLESDLRATRDTHEYEQKRAADEIQSLKAKIASLEAAAPAAPERKSAPEAGAIVANYLKRLRWEALADGMRSGQIDPWAAIDGKSILDVADDCNFARGAACIETMQETINRPPSKWSPQQLESWFESCVPSLDVVRSPTLSTVIKEMYPITWALISDVGAVRSQLSKAGVSEALIGFFVNECSELITRDRKFQS